MSTTKFEILNKLQFSVLLYMKLESQVSTLQENFVLKKI